MAGRIRITDLATPVYTDTELAMLEAGRRHPVELRVDAVLSAAVGRAGLDDFGPEDFVERLGLWLSEIDEDPARSPSGRLTTFNDCTRAAVNRLRVIDLLARHPEIHDIRVKRPLIVVGLPRSGTTHLVNLIAADERLRSMPLWESAEPVPSGREAEAVDGEDPRLVRARRSEERWRDVLPLMPAMHPRDPEHVHEDLALMLSDFSSYQPEFRARTPKWRDYYLSHDQTPHYAWLETGLKILQWYRPRERWVLKCPQHFEQLGPLLATFPDATIVFTHRDPVSVVQSAATMVCYASRMGYDSTDPHWYVAYWADRVQRLLDGYLRDRHLVPAGQQIDLLFHELISDDVGAVERIYEVAGWPMTDAARQQIRAYSAGNVRGRHGQVEYDLRADFDTEPADVRARFGAYHDAVPVRIEVT